MDANQLAATIESVKVMRLGPSDVVIFTTHSRITHETAGQLRDQLSSAIGVSQDKVRVLILEGGCNIEVIRKEDAP